MTYSAEETFLNPSELGNKDYWDNLYEKELGQYLDDSEDEGTIWFAESNAEEKVIDFMESLPIKGSTDSNAGNSNLRILDVGTGNGHQLFALRDEGWKGQMVGVDYSRTSIDLARRIQGSRQTKGNKLTENGRSMDGVCFETWDILKESPSYWLEDGFDIVLDKGTFDAISLSDEELENSRKGCQLYATKVTPLLKGHGYLIVTSCNWTAVELKKWFDSPELIPLSTIKYPQFTFGGKTGQAVSGVCFQKRGSAAKR